MSEPETVADYIAAAPPALQPMLHSLRTTIREAAPEAQERISYGMPYYHLHGRLVYFRVHPHHFGLYPCGEDEARAVGLGGFWVAKSTLHFPLDQPLPLAAIGKLVRHRAEERERSARTQDPRGPSGRNPAR